METSSSQAPQQQAQQQQPLQQQQQSIPSKNLKSWFDEFKAKVSKKSQTSSTGEQISVAGDDVAIKTTKDIPQALSTSKVKGLNLRARKVAKISTSEYPDFDTASVSTIFNRRDSRYGLANSRNRTRIIFPKLVALIKWIIYYSIPFNYNLPWKLICLIDSSFVIIVIGLVSGSSQASTAFNFFNGFIAGLAVASVCFVILTMSFVVQVLPKSHDNGAAKSDSSIQHERSNNDSMTRCMTSISFNESKMSERRDILDPDERKSEDDSVMFEVVGQELGPAPVAPDEEEEEVSQLDRDNELVDDSNYKGWMIEFVGDYELRNSSDIKLKSIYVRIEDRVLYLCKPKNSHDTESLTLPVFTNQRVYDLNNVRKFNANLLLPKSVRNKQKYVWSKKYPIRLEIHQDNRVESGGSAEVGTKVVQLTLFAKSCREKEEWFRRFKRVVEEDRISCGQVNKRSSLKSEGSATDSANESFFGSLRRFRRRSPSPKRDGVQTSQSSHLLAEPKRIIEDEVKASDTGPIPNLVRTKSCELLHQEQSTITKSNQDQDDEVTSSMMDAAADDSTLTRETAELFSQAIEFSNFVDSQPTLNYREYIERVIESGRDATLTSDWFNALTGRILYDVFSHEYWSVWFKRKIQRKLYRIRLPYFMETLTLTKIDLGTNAPQFFNVVSHGFDSYGLSIDFDMAYSGGLTMTFETKLNLLKIKSDNSNNTSGTSNTGAGAAPSNSTGNNLSCQLSEASAKDSCSASDSSSESFNRESNRPPLIRSSNSTRTSGESSDTDESDSDSSSDSSFDEAELNEISDWEDYGAEKTRQNIVKFVDKIASSRYFQHATENRYIKKKLQDISNCPLVLVVKIQSLNGVLTLNVPPPQTDRIWYGFKPTPELILNALPKMGDREVNLSHVTDWIERKLAEEFKKILVIPNMEDIVLPVLKSDHLQYVTPTK